MFVFNLKFNKSKLFKAIIIFFIFIAISILIVSIYKISKKILNSNDINYVNDSIVNDVEILKHEN